MPQIVQLFLGVSPLAVAQDGQSCVPRNDAHQHEDDDGQKENCRNEKGESFYGVLAHLCVSVISLLGRWLHRTYYRAPLAWSGSQVAISGNAITKPMTTNIHTMNGNTPMNTSLMVPVWTGAPSY